MRGVRSTRCGRCGKDERTTPFAARVRGRRRQAWCLKCMKEYRRRWRAEAAAKGKDVRYAQAWHKSKSKQRWAPGEEELVRERARRARLALYLAAK